MARQQQAKSLELRAALSLSRLGSLGTNETLPRRGTNETLLGELVEGFTEGHDTADLRSARAQLTKLSSGD